MSEPKVTASHLRRAAMVYVRQSTLAQVDHNRESTARQYDLASRAVALGWPRSAVRVIDDDLGISGASAAGRSGFAELAAQVGLGQVGIVLSLECSRLARNNAVPPRDGRPLQYLERGHRDCHGRLNHPSGPDYPSSTTHWMISSAHRTEQVDNASIEAVTR